MSKYIKSNPKIMSGVPVIVGTRIPVSRIVYLLSEGHTIDSINELYPHVQKNIFDGVIAVSTNVSDEQIDKKITSLLSRNKKSELYIPLIN